MTKKNNKSFLQVLMSLFKSQTKKQVTTTTSATKPVKKTKSAKNPKTVKKTKSVKTLPVMKGGMIRDGTVVQNMPKRS
jgi:NAD/NADP transhydrogenase beta subunit